MPRTRILLTPGDVQRKLETEFARTSFPHITTMRSLASETGQTLAYVKNWFKERRRTEGANNIANQAPAPVLVAQMPAPVAPVVAVITVHGQPDWQPGMSVQRNVEVQMRNVYGVVREPSRMQRNGNGWIFHPEKVVVHLPKPELIYPGTLAAEIENQENVETSEKDEATFSRLLRIKLKCGICISGAITVRCPSCFKGLCGDCVTSLARHSQSPLNCPYCRNEFDQNPFVGVSFARI